MRYISWAVPLLEVRHVTKYAHHLGHHLGFNHEVEIR